MVTSEHLASTFDRLGVLDGVVVLREPRARGTAPALAWASHEIESRDPGCTMIAMHADHRITPIEGLAGSLTRALDLAADRYLTCIAVRPDRPEVGYGYVELGESLGNGARQVRAFVEKPDADTARRFANDGDHLWNTGIFVWRCVDLLEGIGECAPEVPLDRLETGDVEGFFDRCAAIAIDVAVMERASRVAAVEARFEWDDVGVWNAIARARGSDAAGNTVVGACRMLDAADNVVWTESLRANLIGISGVVVVEANGEILVMPRERAAGLKEDRARLESSPDEPVP